MSLSDIMSGCTKRLKRDETKMLECLQVGKEEKEEGIQNKEDGDRLLDYLQFGNMLADYTIWKGRSGRYM